MSRRCELTGVGPMIGHNVSHSNVKTKRRGGLDAFLVKARDEDLSPRALKIKRQLKAKLADKVAA